VKHKTLISQMTLEEKCSLLSGKTQFTTKALERLGIRSIYLSDGPHGVRKQAGSTDHLGINPSLPATCYPVAATMANSWDTALAEEIGEYLGTEAASQGVSVLLGPGLNIKRNPLCGRNFEYFSEDPYVSGKMAAAYIRGIQKKGISACPKHFAVNSQETFRMANSSILDDRTLHEIYLTGFEIAVEEGKPKSIMTSYNQVNDEYANDSEKLLNDILVKQWKFDGFVVTDWGGSNDRVQGLIAGSHLEMPATKGNSDRECIKAVQEGRIPESLVDKRVDELLSVWMDIMLPEENQPFNEEEHHAFAQKAAEQSIVLMKNEENILPLQAGTRVAVIGDFASRPRYQGAGSSLVNSTKIDIPTEKISQSELSYIGYAQGFNRNGVPDREKMQEAVELSKRAEVILYYMGLDEMAETEGLDRAHMKLHENQIQLLEAMAAVNKNIVVILSAGSVIEMSWDGLAKAVVHGYLSGQAGAGAMVNVLTGKVNPSGKLAETYPVKYEDVPSADFYPGEQRTSEYREGLYVGYRYYDKAGVEVKYPFGYGLSYTEFEYEALEVKEQSVSVTVKNIGSVSGAEVIQLYVASKNKEVFSPEKELKGFQKVFLKAGESVQVEIPLDNKAFRYFNVKTNQYEILGGEYEILIGASSKDVKLKASIVKEGTKAENPYDEKELQSYWSGQVRSVSDKQFAALLGHRIPPHEWDSNALIDKNQPIAYMKYSKNLIVRLVYKVIDHLKTKAEKKGKPDLNILFIYNMPFRGIATMMGGMVDMNMVDAILTIVNGRFFKGLGQLWKSYRSMKRGQKEGIQG
jgi:beta-glucosidase